MHGILFRGGGDWDSVGCIGGNGDSKGIKNLCGCGVVKVVGEGIHMGYANAGVVRACALEANVV